MNKAAFFESEKKVPTTKPALFINNNQTNLLSIKS